ncbi:MAG TPA: hypothetical protein VKM37_03615 [Balneolaceae bacterium]|nr:hypothetical protein [Balneolaceae bacterium]
MSQWRYFYQKDSLDGAKHGLCQLLRLARQRFYINGLFFIITGYGFAAGMMNTTGKEKIRKYFRKIVKIFSDQLMVTVSQIPQIPQIPGTPSLIFSFSSFSLYLRQT